jgi:RimJ/RimL family protein N-acetyltransferase
MTDLTTERLRLRPVASGDVDALLVHQTNPEVMRYVSGGVRTRAAIEALVSRSVEQWSASGHGLFALSHRETGELVGYCGLLAGGGAARAGAIVLDMILSEEHWTQGIGSEAAAAVIAFARGKGIAELVALPHGANVAAHRVCEKNAMTSRGTARHDGIECAVYAVAP